MTALDRILDLLPPPYSAASDSMLGRLLEVAAIEIDVLQEDIDRLRATHWIAQAWRFEDVRKIAALLRIEPLPWETLDTFRARLLPLVTAFIEGALGPVEIRRFVHAYLASAAVALDATLVQGLPPDFDAAFRDPPVRPAFRPLVLAEYPQRIRTSASLAARSGLVPVLLRWSEVNRGLDEAVARFTITGLAGRRTVTPMLINLTTGDALFFADRVPAGAELAITQARPDAGRLARATLDGFDVTAKLRSFAGFVPGRPYTPADFDPEPLLPRLPRGPTEWLYLSVGQYDVRGLDQFHFAMAEADLFEGRFDDSRFDHALFPAGPHAHVAMEWTESEPASFEVVVPRTIVAEPEGSASGGHAYELVEQALRAAIGSLHAAGVRAETRFAGFAESQPQAIRHILPWIVLDRESGPAGTGDALDFGIHFEETGLGHARFE